MLRCCYLGKQREREKSQNIPIQKPLIINNSNYPIMNLYKIKEGKNNKKVQLCDTVKKYEKKDCYMLGLNQQFLVTNLSINNLNEISILSKDGDSAVLVGFKKGNIFVTNNMLKNNQFYKIQNICSQQLCTICMTNFSLSEPRDIFKCGCYNNAICNECAGQIDKCPFCRKFK